MMSSSYGKEQATMARFKLAAVLLAVGLMVPCSAWSASVIQPAVFQGSVHSAMPLAHTIGDIDVAVRFVPLASPSGLAETAVLPTPHLSFDPGQAIFVEVWISDVNNTGQAYEGVVAGYLDVTYDSQWVDAVALAQGDLFTAFAEGSIDDAAGKVTNFGGSNSNFAPQGVEPTWARLGQIEMQAGVPSNTVGVVINGEIGVGGIGAYGRQAGVVDVATGQFVITPEPSSLFLLLGGALGLRRRRRR